MRIGIIGSAELGPRALVARPRQQPGSPVYIQQITERDAQEALA